MTLRSLAANTPSRRANWRALGLSAEDMLKPKIAVVNSSSELAIWATANTEPAARNGVGYVTEATGYLANFRQDVQPMSTGGVLLPRNG